jgi:GPH family glycoside/pentoside/hexuronide:cation symporter
VAVSIATVVSAYLARWTGFIEGATTQSATTMLWIRAWEIGLPPLLCLVSVLLLLKYPLTETRAYEIKALLRESKEMPPKSASARASVS